MKPYCLNHCWPIMNGLCVESCIINGIHIISQIRGQCVALTRNPKNYLMAQEFIVFDFLKRLLQHASFSLYSIPRSSRQGVGTGLASSNFAASHYLT